MKKFANKTSKNLVLNSYVIIESLFQHQYATHIVTPRPLRPQSPTALNHRSLPQIHIVLNSFARNQLVEQLGQGISKCGGEGERGTGGGAELLPQSIPHKLHDLPARHPFLPSLSLAPVHHRPLPYPVASQENKFHNVVISALPLSSPRRPKPKLLDVGFVREGVAIRVSLRIHEVEFEHEVADRPRHVYADCPVAWIENTLSPSMRPTNLKASPHDPLELQKVLGLVNAVQSQK